MGKGLALAFKQKFPEMFPVYQQECKTGRLRIGRPTLYRQSTPWILNFPTKKTWRANSKIEYLEKGLEYFIANYKQAGIQSVAFPKLGAQNGKLSWDDVGPLMVKYLSQLDIDVYIYIAEGDREYQLEAQLEIISLEVIWQHFNGIAVSAELLMQEIQGLSQRAAKKIAERRTTIEFHSQADIDTIDGLAKSASTLIRKYISHQQFTAKELPGIADKVDTDENPKYTRTRAKRSASTKTKNKKAETDAASLFVLHDVAI
jgi:O-acetyl-ADP-ribose deacetylase (regulator of RNase III)